MTLHQLKEEILKHAAEEARKLIEEAHKKEAEIIAAKKELLEKREDETAEITEKELAALERKELAAVTVETRKYLYEKKSQLMEDIFKEVKHNLQKLGKKEKTAIISALLKKASKEFVVAIIYCNPADKECVKTSANTINIIGDETIAGGIIVENKEKTIRIDYTVENTLQQLKEQKLQELAYTLFD